VLRPKALAYVLVPMIGEPQLNTPPVVAKGGVIVFANASAKIRETSGLADHQAFPSRFHNRLRHFLKRVDFKNSFHLRQ
jgi:hypothetical protein